MRVQPRFVLFLLPALLSAAQITARAETISLGAAMRLAGAGNHEVRIAEERLAEARAKHESARRQFFPVLTPGFAVRGHSGRAQTVDGQMIDAEKQSLSLGVAVTLQLELGEAWYQELAARRLASAAGFSVEAQRQETMWQAVSGYLDLVHAAAAAEVARDAVRISEEFEKQLAAAADAGLAAQADRHRAAVQTAGNRMKLRQAEESRRLVSARLAQQLFLSPLIVLTPQETSPAPVSASFPNSTTAQLAGTALRDRPEIHMSAEQLLAAVTASTAARYAPLVPSVRAEVGLGGLGGGQRGDGFESFAESSDYGISLMWRIGPGGLFDAPRRKAADARTAIAEIDSSNLRNEIIRQVVEATEKSRSAADQMSMARAALEAATETLKLETARRDLGIGGVLARIEAQKDLLAAREAWLHTITGYNKAQFLLNRAVGVADTKK